MNTTQIAFLGDRPTRSRGLGTGATPLGVAMGGLMGKLMADSTKLRSGGGLTTFTAYVLTRETVQ